MPEPTSHAQRAAELAGVAETILTSKDPNRFYETNALAGIARVHAELARMDQLRPLAELEEAEYSERRAARDRMFRSLEPDVAVAMCAECRTVVRLADAETVDHEGDPLTAGQFAGDCPRGDGKLQYLGTAVFRDAIQADSAAEMTL